jgi:sodium-dependent phosphate transporter
MEFLGAVLAGSRVTDTIRNKIIDVSLHSSAPAGLMLLMTCALVGSSTWLTIATTFGMPVSTTHSIVGGVIGAGIAASGASSVHWGWSGFSSIVASWFIAPLIAGGFSAIIFLITKYGILERTKSLTKSIYSIPIYFAFTVGILTMSVVWKGAPNLHLDKLSTGAVIAAIFGCAGVAILVYFVFFYPYFRRRLIQEDWTLKWYHIFLGPLLLKRGDVPPMPAGTRLVIDYYDKTTGNSFHGVGSAAESVVKTISSEGPLTSQDAELGLKSPHYASDITPTATVSCKPIDRITKETWPELRKPRNWGKFIWLAATDGLRHDILLAQVGESNKKDFLSGDLKGMHSRARKYDVKLEYCFSFLQVLTACTMSWSHGSNDIANACGPLSTIYAVWKTNETGSKSPVPVWILVYAAAALVFGLYTYGFHIMRNLGNKFTLQSPTRGFAIELGAAVTTVFATRLALPISSTQCLVGSTIFVGLCNNDLRAINWRIVTWCYLGWIVTVPCAGLISGIIMALITNAPQLGVAYVPS